MICAKNWADEYSAQILDVVTGSGWVPHVKIRRHDGKDVNCGWDVLQAIKNDVAGSDATAVEVFPSENNLVDEAPIRHLWVVPESLLDFGLHR